MPYIKQEDRNKMDPEIKSLARSIRSYDVGMIKVDPGKLNYVITKLILEIGFKPSYAEFNAVIGALECCKLEAYRRTVAPYEDTKISENGDVYPNKDSADSCGYDH
jgi:hypothetical protein